MNFARKFFASFFAKVAYVLLRLCGWKRATVYANLRHVGAAGTSCRENSCEGVAAETACEGALVRSAEKGGRTAAETACEGAVVAKVRGGSFAEIACEGASSKVRGETAAETACEKLYLELLHNLTRHVGELLFCFKTFKKLPTEFAAYPCRVDGWKFDLAPGAAETLAKMREGGIFLTAHYGNYEAMGPWLCRLGIPLVASYIPVKPAWLNRILEGRIRAVDGCSYSVNARTPREFVRLLQDGKLFCLLADQDSRISSALADEFMGQPVRNNPLPDFLLKHCPETPVYVCWIEECDGNFGRGCADVRGDTTPRDGREARDSQEDRDSQDARDCKNASDGRATRVLHAEQIPVQTQSLGAGARGSQITRSGQKARGCAEPEPFASVMVKYNAWLEKRIAENPALWYGFTHRRFYSCEPRVYM